MTMTTTIEEILPLGIYIELMDLVGDHGHHMFADSTDVKEGIVDYPCTCHLCKVEFTHPQYDMDMCRDCFEDYINGPSDEVPVRYCASCSGEMSESAHPMDTVCEPCLDEIIASSTLDDDLPF